MKAASFLYPFFFFLLTFNFFTGVTNIPFCIYAQKQCVLEQAFVVGHDWGAQVAWNLCLLRPDRVKALVNLGVPYFPRSREFKPIEIFTKTFGDGLYISQFQV
jgi:hypothetical protein